MRLLAFLPFLALLAHVAGCVSTGSTPPAELAAAVVADLEAGRPAAAAGRFEPVANDSSYRERVYPVVFAAARQHYESGDGATSAALLRFLVDAYPDASAAREALVYALFLERAVLGADSERNEELDRHLATLRERGGEPPLVVALVTAQSAVDRGRPAEARAALDRFLAGWDGQPPELLPYVEDLGRYVQLQSGGGRP